MIVHPRPLTCGLRSAWLTLCGLACLWPATCSTQALGGEIDQSAESATALPESKPLPLTANDWPWWRGHTRDGIAAKGQRPPTAWSASKNVLWKAPLSGRGHASATVVGQRVFLPTADEKREVQTIICLDRETGRTLWSQAVHQGNLDKRGHQRSSQASSTIACDGQRLYANFLHGGAIHTTALSLDGKPLWQRKVCDFQTHQGFASSPAIYDSLLIISADNRGGGLVTALDRQTGQPVWSHRRPKLPNYTSPTILNVAGRDQVLLSGCNLVSSYDPLSGKKLWETEGATTECVTTMVTDGQRVFTSGGYPQNHMRDPPTAAWRGRTTRACMSPRCWSTSSICIASPTPASPCVGTRPAESSSGNTAWEARSTPRPCWSTNTFMPPTKREPPLFLKRTRTSFGSWLRTQLVTRCSHPR